LTNTRRRRRWESASPLSSRNVRILLWILGVGIGGFLLGYAFISLVLYGGPTRPAVVAVPELRELPANDAERRLSSLGLVMVIGDSLPNPDVPEGAVLAQSPLAGREVIPGTGVRVILSAGRARREIVDVSAMGRGQAERVLEALGFEVEVVEEPAPLAAGRVVGTDPPPGTVLAVHSRVRLTVSAGPPMAAVPDVVGLLEDDARDALESTGFRVREVIREFRLTDAGMVVGQFPLPGDSARVGSGVEIRVATDRWFQDDQ
jgi:eukaryotic-like serine/threonine-protein kinase